MKRVLGALALFVAVTLLFLWLDDGRWLIVQQARARAEPEFVTPSPGIAVETDNVFAKTQNGPLRLDLYTPDPRPPGKLRPQRLTNRKRCIPSGGGSCPRADSTRLRCSGSETSTARSS